MDTLTLYCGRKRIHIGFRGYLEPDRRWLIRYFRESIPFDGQVDWDLFDYRCGQFIFAPRPEPEFYVPQVKSINFPEWQWWVCVGYLCFFLIAFGVLLCFPISKLADRFIKAILLLSPVVLIAMFTAKTVPGKVMMRRKIVRRPMQFEKWLAVGCITFLSGTLAAMIGDLIIRGQHELDVVDAAVLMIAFLTMAVVWVWMMHRGDQLDRKAAKLATKQWAGRPPWDPDREPIHSCAHGRIVLNSRSFRGRQTPIAD